MSLRPCLALSLALAACTLRPYEFGDSATGTDTTGDTTTTTGSGLSTADSGTVPTTSSSTTTGPIEPTTTDPTDSTTDGGCRDFICIPDIPGGTKQCDQWTQNCPEGQKCMPYSGDGDNSWESLKCVDIVPDPDGMYEPCTAGLISTGEDTCDEGLMCWDLVDGIGYCVGLCIGSADAPACADPDALCHIAGDGVLTICLPFCDPLLPNCDPGDICVPTPSDPGRFRCLPDISGDEGQVFDPCEEANACDPGLLCVNPLIAVECDPMAPGCCTPFCDITAPNNCPGQDQECVAWYEPGMAPPGYENIGACALPTP